MAFWDSGAGKVHNVLLSRNDRVVSSEDIKAACKALGIEYGTALSGLSRTGALVPVVFRGVYYVRDREERDLKTIKE
ncbi:MAG: hypothetical protein V1708_00050, partial [Candidatus Micrarchaeota archaeon]